MQSHGKKHVGKHKRREWYSGGANDMQDVNGSQDQPEKISKSIGKTSMIALQWESVVG